MDKAKNIYTILRNIDFDGTVKYIEGRIQMTNAGFEFNVQEHLFAFAQKFYEEGLKHHEKISDELTRLKSDCEEKSFELVDLIMRVEQLKPWINSKIETNNRLKNNLKATDYAYLQGENNALNDVLFALKNETLIKD